MAWGGHCATLQVVVGTLYGFYACKLLAVGHVTSVIPLVIFQSPPIHCPHCTRSCTPLGRLRNCLTDEIVMAFQTPQGSGCNEIFSAVCQLLFAWRPQPTVGYYTPSTTQHLTAPGLLPLGVLPTATLCLLHLCVHICVVVTCLFLSFPELHQRLHVVQPSEISNQQTECLPSTVLRHEVNRYHHMHIQCHACTSMFTLYVTVTLVTLVLVH